MKINQAARVQMVQALRKMEMALASGETQATVTQLSALFVQASRVYATQAALAAIPMVSAEYETPPDCVDPVACGRAANCLFVGCSYRTEALA